MILILFTLFFSQDPVESLLDDGYEQYEQGEFELAIATFDKALSLAPDNPEIYFLRGISYHGLEETRKAIGDLEMAIKLDPDYGDAYQQMGFIYLVGQAAAEAIKAFDRAIELNPELPELYVNRGTARCMNGDPEGARVDWEKAQAMGVQYTEYMKCD